MKKIFLFLAPIITYLMACGITKTEEQIAYMPDTVMHTFVLKCVFFVLLGFSLCYFSRHITSEFSHRSVHAICIAGILLPVILWLYFIKHYVGNLDQYFLVYFLYLGSYGYAAFTYFLKKRRSL